MPGNVQWLMAPVIAGMCKYESLIDGTLDLYDIRLMNDALSVHAENLYRAREAMKSLDDG